MMYVFDLHRVQQGFSILVACARPCLIGFSHDMKAERLSYAVAFALDTRGFAAVCKAAIRVLLIEPVPRFSG